MTDIPRPEGDRLEIYTDAPDELVEHDSGPTDAITAEGPCDDIDEGSVQAGDEAAEPQRRQYEAREGVDYIPDFYSLAGVPRDADDDTVRHALDTAIRKYHPDRVDDLAEEFRERAAVVGPLLLRARAVLRDPGRRADYDELLETWDGPVSTDGRPVISLDRLAQAQASMLDSDGARALIDSIDTQISAMLGFNRDQLDAAQRLADKYPDDPDARAALEEKLLEYDRLLALREVKRRELAGGGQFGIEQIEQNGYRVGLGYSEQVAGEIEGARQQRLEHEQWLAIGGAAGRLAITGGESTAPTEPSTELQPAGEVRVSLPPVFETAANEIAGIAAQREELLERRLDNLQLTYPVAEAQTAPPRNRLIVGFGDPGNPTWLGFNRDVSRLSIDELDIDDETAALLSRGDFAELNSRGYGVVFSPVLEQVEPMALLNAVIQKYFSPRRQPEA